jgi:hypothetical protein
MKSLALSCYLPSPGKEETCKVKLAREREAARGKEENK